jgi:hypothetical protein
MKKSGFVKSSTKGNTGLKNGNSSHALLLANEGYGDEAIAERAGRCLRGQPICGNGLWMIWMGMEGWGKIETTLEGKPNAA